MKKIIVVTTDGASREDGSVYYSRFILVESDTLNFDEPIFTDAFHGPRAYDDESSSDQRMDEVVAEIQMLGYTVDELDSDIIEVKAE